MIHHACKAIACHPWFMRATSATEPRAVVVDRMWWFHVFDSTLYVEPSGKLVERNDTQASMPPL